MSKDPKDQAIHWMLRQRAGDMDETEWDAFTAWLEEAEDHAKLLDDVTAADDALGQLVAGAGNADSAASPAVTLGRSSGRTVSRT